MTGMTAPTHKGLYRNAPLLIGGWGDRTLRVVARHADVWNIPGPPHNPVGYIAERMQVLDAHCADLGRDPATLVRSVQTHVRYDDPAATRATVRELAAIGVGFVASYIAVVEQIGDTSSGGYLLIFWMFQNPPDLIFSVIKGMFMATAIVLVGCYYGYTASGGPVGVGTATAKSMVLNIVLVHIIGMMGTLVFWGANPRAPIGG